MPAKLRQLNTIPGEAMFGITDPEGMTPEERVREVAEILARGYLRLRIKAPYQGDKTLKSNGANHVTSDISKGCDLGKSTS